jgi:hypothetical protein
MEHDDKTQSHRAEQDSPNRESNMEKAEGSREAVNADLAGNQASRGSAMKNDESELPEEAVGQADDPAGGISNRPLDEEQERQEQVPPRGERRENWKDD